MTSSKRFSSTTLLMVLIVFLAGCATVEVERVCDADYTTHGFRFYRPRPYIVVNKAFPVGGDDFFIYGVVDAKSRVVVVDASQLPDPIKTSFVGISQYKIGIPFSAVSDPVQSHSQQGLSAGKDTTPAKGSSSPDKSTATSQPVQSQSITVSATQPTTQQSTLKTTSDPSMDPFEKLNDYVGVVYLPDFDQQYAIHVSGGLGTASASLQMKNGWMTEDASWNVDNRELGQFVFGNITKLIDLGTTVAEQAVAPGSAELAKLATVTQQGEEPTATVLLRIRYVVQSCPGVYPLLKPREASTDNDAVASRHHILLPLPPYTVVAYNYTASVAVELVSVSATNNGGTGSVVPGEARTLSGADAAAIAAWLGANSIPGLNIDSNVPFGLASDGTLIIPVTGTPPADAEAKLNAALAKNPIQSLSQNGKVTKITVKPTG